MFVKTHSAKAKVIGTTLDLTVAPNQTRLEVVKGQVELIRHEDGATVQTKSGFSATVREGTELNARPLLPAPWISRDTGTRAPRTVLNAFALAKAVKKKLEVFCGAGASVLV